MENRIPEIRFYLKRNPYGCFSNFAPYPVVIDGKLWTTTEHYYQAQKFIGTEYEEKIREVIAPFRAKAMAKKEGMPKRKDWFDVKFDVMMIAVKAKFDQHENLRDILISTGNAILIEHTELDLYWGDGGDGSGRSRLGEALMKIRCSYPEYDDIFYVPPWKAFSTRRLDSQFWTEDRGGEYLNKFLNWYGKLSSPARREYDAYFVMPGKWQGFREKYGLTT